MCFWRLLMKPLATISLATKSNGEFSAVKVLLQQEVIRKDWMFKLVGKESFVVGSSKTKATIKIEALSGFAYEYSLEVDGKSLQKFTQNRAQTTRTWLLKVEGQDYRVVLGEWNNLIRSVGDFNGTPASDTR